VAGNDYVPVGSTVWELSTEKDPAAKAQTDYDKRSTGPSDLDRRTITYVAVTGHRWPGRDEWAEKRSNEQVWKEVRAYDADDLHGWMILSRTTQDWLANEMGIHPVNVQSPEEWWMDYGAVSRLTPPNLVLSGRELAGDALIARLTGAAGVVFVQGRDEEESLGFMMALLQEIEDPLRLGILARTALIEDRQTWLAMRQERPGLILVPLFLERDVKMLHGAAARGHVVVLPTPHGVPVPADAIVLPPLPKDAVIKELQGTGVAPSVIDRAVAGPTLSISEVRLAVDLASSPERPEWAQPGNARQLCPFVLAGQWDDTAMPDRQILEQLATRTYTELTDTLVRWRLSPRPPVRKTGTLWSIVSRGETWSWIYSSYVEDDFKRFRDVSVAVLRQPDPKFDLDPKDRWMAAARGKRTTHSAHLRHGLADGLALLGARSADSPIDGQLSAQDWACLGVRQILADADWKLWASLAPLLSLLAEACPDEFLAAVERGLAGSDPPLAKLFIDFIDSDFPIDSPHTGLLFALECLGRPADYLARVALALAKLSQLDPPGGKLANRPLASLMKLFRLALPQTLATADQRLAVLDTLRNRFPDIAWTTMLAALPVAGGILVPSTRPHWRKWALKGE
jgi:hypothetical protein